MYVPPPKADQVELSTHEEAGDDGAGIEGGDAADDGVAGGDATGGTPGGAGSGVAGAGGVGGEGHVPHVAGQAVVWPYVLL